MSPFYIYIIYRFMKIVLYTGYHKTPWGPSSIETTGLGGTEKTTYYLAQELAKLPEYYIWVVGNVIPGDFDNVKYRTTKQFKQEESSVDTIIGVNYIHYLKEFEDFNYKNSIFWLSNTDYYNWWNGEEIPNHRELLIHPKLKYIICLTKWHREIWLQQYPETESKIKIIGYGIDASKIIKTFPEPQAIKGLIFPKPTSQLYQKNKNQYIYSSHAERGLARVLEDWPQIKQEAPDSSLKICTPEYGLEYYNQYYKEWVDSLDDVEFLGTLPEKELYKLMADSQYWYYPSTYEETFCLTALEMLGHQVLPITWEWGGLKETLHGFNALNENDNINWQLAQNYVYSLDWWYITIRNWIPLLLKLNMNLDHFYVIALNETQQIKDKCDKLSMPGFYNYWVKTGFDYRTLTQKDLVKFGVKKHPNWKIESSCHWWNREVTDGEVGCALAHIDAWVDAYEYDREITFILEEDFKEQLPVNWEDIKSLLDKGYDMIYLGRNALKPDLEKPIEGFRNWVEPDYSYNSHAYILSRSGVQKLVEEWIPRYKSKIFALDEFLSITFGMTHRQDILADFADLPKLKVAAPKVNYFEQDKSVGVTEGNKPTIEILDDSNWEEWCKKYIDPYILKGQYKLMTDEIGPNIIEFPLFTEKFCDEVIALAEQNEWKTDRHTFYPTTDQTMESLKMQKIYQKVLEQFVYPIWIWFWELEGNNWQTSKSENFIAKYDTNNQGSLDIHHDSSAITLNVRLNDEFKGGGTFIPRYKLTIQPQRKGYAMAHPGQITHKHGGRPVIEGTRYILISFTNP